ncbi:isocitrate lyase/PEP mutase family protein [Labrys okinawensis]|uniref:isocitrate lyase/PEP mutase family protein n=1 Tax=Labrys okinawensis TaxID=346911 RepID=UPI0039BCD611
MMSQAQKAAAFADLHRRSELFLLPNAWDVGSAKLLSSLGFSAIATTSAGLAFSYGRKDGQMSREETLANAGSIVSASELPVSADLENGFGDSPEACQSTIRDAVGVGLAGGSIEDATGRPDQPIYEIGLATERVRAAAETARAAGFVLTARAENFLHGIPDLDDTIRRLQAFQEAGAEVLYAPGLSRLDQIKSVLGSVDRPVNILATLAGQEFSIPDLAGLGIRRVSVGGSFARAAFGALKRAALELRDEGRFGFAKDAMPYSELAAIFGK